GIASIAIEPDQAAKRVTILGVAGKIVLEQLDGFGPVPARIQRHRIDEDVARAIRLDLGGAAKLGYGLVLALEPNQRKPQRVMQARVLRRRLTPLPERR